MLVWKQKFITFLVFVVGLLAPIAANSQETSSEESVIDFGSMTSFDAVYFKPPNHDYEVSIEIYLHDKKFFYVPYFFIDLQDLEAAKIRYCDNQLDTTQVKPALLVTVPRIQDEISGHINKKWPAEEYSNYPILPITNLGLRVWMLGEDGERILTVLDDSNLDDGFGRNRLRPVYKEPSTMLCSDLNTAHSLAAEGIDAFQGVLLVRSKITSDEKSASVSLDEEFRTNLSNSILGTSSTTFQISERLGESGEQEIASSSTASSSKDDRGTTNSVSTNLPLNILSASFEVGDAGSSAERTDTSNNQQREAFQKEFREISSSGGRLVSRDYLTKLLAQNRSTWTARFEGYDDAEAIEFLSKANDLFMRQQEFFTATVQQVSKDQVTFQIGDFKSQISVADLGSSTGLELLSNAPLDVEVALLGEQEIANFQTLNITSVIRQRAGVKEFAIAHDQLSNQLFWEESNTNRALIASAADVQTTYERRLSEIVDKANEQIEALKSQIAEVTNEASQLQKSLSDSIREQMSLLDAASADLSAELDALERRMGKEMDINSSSFENYVRDEVDQFIDEQRGILSELQTSLQEETQSKIASVESKVRAAERRLTAATRDFVTMNEIAPHLSLLGASVKLKTSFNNYYDEIKVPSFGDEILYQQSISGTVTVKSYNLKTGQTRSLGNSYSRYNNLNTVESSNCWALRGSNAFLFIRSVIDGELFDWACFVKSIEEKEYYFLFGPGNSSNNNKTYIVEVSY